MVAVDLNGGSGAVGLHKAGFQGRWFRWYGAQICLSLLLVAAAGIIGWLGAELGAG
jgi:hypothetical protein